MYTADAPLKGKVEEPRRIWPRQRQCKRYDASLAGVFVMSMMVYPLTVGAMSDPDEKNGPFHLKP